MDSLVRKATVLTAGSLSLLILMPPYDSLPSSALKIDLSCTLFITTQHLWRTQEQTSRHFWSFERESYWGCQPQASYSVCSSDMVRSRYLHLQFHLQTLCQQIRFCTKIERTGKWKRCSCRFGGFPGATLHTHQIRSTRLSAQIFCLDNSGWLNTSITEEHTEHFKFLSSQDYHSAPFLGVMPRLSRIPPYIYLRNLAHAFNCPLLIYYLYLYPIIHIAASYFHILQAIVLFWLLVKVSFH